MSFWSTISFGLIKTTRDKERESAISRANKQQNVDSIFNSRQQGMNYSLANKQLDYSHYDHQDDNKTKIELAKIESDKAKSIAESTGKYGAEAAKYGGNMQNPYQMMGNQQNPYQQNMRFGGVSLFS